MAERAAPAASLGAFLAAQRWSGARGDMPPDARVEAMVPLDFAPWVVAIVAADVGGRATRYQVLVPRDARDASLGVSDGVADPAFRLGLAHAIAHGRRLAGEGAAFVATPEPGGADVLAHVRDSRLGSAEQSNTSILYDDVAIIKLFRRLEPGINPDVEMIGHLTRRGFPHVPALLGTVTVEDARGASVAAMAQRLVPGASDEWAHAVASARAYVAGDGPDYGDDAARLGRVTRAMHDALADDASDAAFAPVPADRATLARWAAGATRSIAEGARLFTERGARGDAALDGAAFTSRVAALVERIGDDVGAAVRHHGDYHLGQVLRAADGALYVIDFEGEPAKALDERRARHSALRDVAGMLRSFAYAAATAERERDDEPRARDRAAAWERAARDAYLAAYLGGGTPAYLPHSPAATSALLALFELEKVFYELQYELRNRPDWVGIPLDGIRRLADA